MQISMFSSEEPPASHSPSQGSELEWLTHEEISPLHIWRLLIVIAPNGWSGKTSPVSCHQTEEGILVPSSGAWLNSGMGGPIESLTLSTSVWPSDARVCSLLQILETGDVPQQYFLTARACRGILRRAEKRGKELPTQLLHALQAVAGASNALETPEDKTQL